MIFFYILQQRTQGFTIIIAPSVYLLRANVCKPIACANAEQQEIKKGETILQDQTARGIFISDENRPESASFNNQGSMIGALLIKWEPLTTPI